MAQTIGLFDADNMLFGSVANRVVTYQTITGDINGDSLDTGSKCSATVDVVLGTVQNTGGESYRIKIQTSKNSDFSDTGDIIDESEYDIDPSWSNTQKVFKSRISKKYVRGVFEVTGSLQTSVFLS